MKVKLHTARAGHIHAKGTDGALRVVGEFVQAAGDIIDLPNDEANRLVEKGYASRVNENSK